MVIVLGKEVLKLVLYWMFWDTYFDEQLICVLLYSSIVHNSLKGAAGLI